MPTTTPSNRLIPAPGGPAVAFKHTLKRGSTRPVLRYPLPGVDLTGATATFLMSPRPGQSATVNAPAVIANGALEYHWQHGDTSAAVMHYGEFEVVFPGGAIETFPNDDYIRIEVKQDIGDGGSVAPPALIVLSAALVEVGVDVASGSASVGISLFGAMAEDGSDTASGSMTVTTPAPGSISLSAALVEAGADTASGAASVGIAMSAAMAETGADTAVGSALVGITLSAAIAESGADTAAGEIAISLPAAWNVMAVDAGILISASPFPPPPLAMAGSGAILIGA